MKKVNGGYIVKQFVITVIVALIIGVAAWLALSVRAGQFSEPTLIVFSVMACFLGWHFVEFVLHGADQVRNPRKHLMQDLRSIIFRM